MLLFVVYTDELSNSQSNSNAESVLTRAAFSSHFCRLLGLLTLFLSFEIMKMAVCRS